MALRNIELAGRMVDEIYNGMPDQEMSMLKEMHDTIVKNISDIKRDIEGLASYALQNRLAQFVNTHLMEKEL